MTKIPSPSEPTIRRQELGHQLQTLRKASQFTLEQAARRIAVSPSKLCRIESGQRKIATQELGGLLSIYDVDAAKRTELLALASNCGERGWRQRNPPDRVGTLMALESRAERIVNFAGIVVPSLLQTLEYAQAIMLGSRMLSKAEIDDGVTGRLCRQSILMGRQPPEMLALVDELVLHRVIGDRDVLRRQLEHLVKLSQQRHISIRVIPNEGAHPGMTGDFELIEQSARSPVAFVEQPASSLFIEEPDDIKAYGQIVRGLSDAALDEPQSRCLISSLANACTRERAPDEADRSQHCDMAQEQL